MSKKVLAVILISLLLIVVIGCSGYFIFKNIHKLTPEETLKQFAIHIQNAEYEDMYDLISEESKQNISKEDFIERNKNIYSGISMTNYILEIKSEEEQKDKSYKLNYDVYINTASSGEINFSSSSRLVKNKETKRYELDWSSNFIFPNLDNTDKVRVKTVESQRGEIIDRNGKLLAGLGEVSSVGFVPGKMNEDSETDIQKVSELLEVSVDTIKNSLNANWVKDNTFVPIKKVAVSNQELKDALLEVPGIKINRVKERVYPLSESISHLIGYVQNVTAEDLEKNPDKGYSRNKCNWKSWIRKTI